MICDYFVGQNGWIYTILYGPINIVSVFCFVLEKHEAGEWTGIPGEKRMTIVMVVLAE